MDFINSLCNDLMNNMWLPKETSEDVKNMKLGAAVEVLRQIYPQGGIEGLLAVQMTSTQQAAMECLRRAAIPNQTFEGRNMALKHGFYTKEAIEERKQLNKMIKKFEKSLKELNQ